MADSGRGATRTKNANRGATPQPQRSPDAADIKPRKKKKQVVRRSRPDTGERVSGALLHHQQVCLQSLLRLITTPMASIMTCLVMAIALVLPSLMMVAVDNIKQLSAGWDGTPQLTLYLQGSAEPVELIQRLNDDPRIDSLVYMSADQALAEFVQYSGLADVASQLDSNPLPAIILLRPELEALQGDSGTQLIKEMQGLPEVDMASLDLEWVERLGHILLLTERASWLLAALLALAVLLVIGNTIRLSIEGRRSEIVVIKLVGGSDAYVRRPFLYTGLWYGAIAGLLAALIVQILVLLVDGPAERLAELYQSRFDLQGLGLEAAFLLVLIGGFLGWSGAWLASVRHLRDIEPR